MNTPSNRCSSILIAKLSACSYLLNLGAMRLILSMTPNLTVVLALQLPSSARRTRGSPSPCSSRARSLFTGIALPTALLYSESSCVAPHIS